ncbi:hypothetical protein J6TS2_32190 [Heyndrickxia sporothermodurans]|nr:hypothetical protein J6TS2_32190 [Heyndrickxia sporothermodurans]
MLWLIRLAIFALIIYLIIKIITYLFNPKRKLELAREEKRYYFHDDLENVRKNFLITFNGAVFEGEKYLGTTKQSFEVISIFVWPHDVNALNGLTYQDFLFLEKEIQLRYPSAAIDWKSPIKELVSKNRN